MSDYTIQVSWSGKDSLADSDANKIISGGDFNTEFSAVRTAVNSKYDSDDLGSTLQQYDADTAKLDVAQNWSAGQNFQDNYLQRVNLKDYGEVTNAIGATGGGTQDIDLSLGNSVSATVDTSANTFTFSNPTASDEQNGFVLYLTNGGSQTVNWPASVDFAGGTVPTLTTAGVDVLVFTTIDAGTRWYGFAAGLDMK
jgi:hypothetical protein